MKVLVLSCSTGGGHNTAAKNIVKGLNQSNIDAHFQDYLSLFDPKKKKIVEQFYYKSLLGKGKLFEGIYKLGELYNKTKLTSPVYILNKYGKERVKELILKEHYDLCICTHLYPALALTELKKEMSIPFFFVGTDYKCIPFTNEIKADYYVIPTKDLESDYLRMMLPKEKLLPFGIPIFIPELNQDVLRKKLNISYKQTILMMSGSMGFGPIPKVVKDLLKKMDNDTGLIVICGQNEKLYQKLSTLKDERLQVLKFIPNVLEYVSVADIVLTKPGGLTTTEVSVLRKPILHIFPIPGVETYNAKYFSENNLSLIETNKKKVADTALFLLNNKELQKTLTNHLEAKIPSHSLEELCTFICKNFK